MKINKKIITAIGSCCSVIGAVITVPLIVTSCSENAEAQVLTFDTWTFNDGIKPTLTSNATDTNGIDYSITLTLDKNDNGSYTILHYDVPGLNDNLFAVDLTDVSINNQDFVLESITEYAFEESNIVSISLPDSVIYVGSSAFAHCDELSSVNLNEGLLEIRSLTFAYCDKLVDITIPNTVKTIGGGAFQWCPKLESINVPDSVTSIGPAAFLECTSLTSVSIGEGVKNILDKTFLGCTSLKEVTLGNNIETLGIRAFENCEQLKQVNLDENLQAIEESCFHNCGLETIVIPNSVTTIGPSAFLLCNNLESVTIGSGILELKSGAFWGTANLKNVYFTSDVCPEFGWECFSLGNAEDDNMSVLPSNALFYYPAGKDATYFTNATGFSDSWINPDNIVETANSK